ncbi:MAG: hypothetical protein ACUVTZ_04660 [Armatimonadota bacterium]
MRYRNMFHLTGLPGWMRFGFSPGWIGRSPTGLSPCAQYLLTGQWPGWTAAAGVSSAQLDLLKAQAEALRRQLSLIEERIRQLETRPEGGKDTG